MNIPAPHPVQWTTPAPLWRGAVTPGGATSSTAPRMREPALLTIAQDRFMDALATLLAAHPIDLAPSLARPVSYRVRPPGMADDWEPGGPPPLKLYQPAHGQFNLVAATLVCQLPGLPEHQVHPEHKEQVGFVLRRWDGTNEYAWSADQTAGATGMTWSQIKPGSFGQLAPDEKLLPLFPVRYSDGERPHCLYVGLVPTSSVETFHQASTTVAPGTGTPPPSTDLMAMAFMTRVGNPLDRFKDTGAAGVGSPMLALEFASFLNDWFPTSWPEVLAGQPPSVNATLYNHLHSEWADTATGQRWLDVVTTAWQQRLSLTGEAPPPNNPLTFDVFHSSVDGATIRGWIQAATLETSGTMVPGAPSASTPQLDPGHLTNPLEYRIRCVYRRPECLVVDDIVSDPTTQFEIAMFYDFDAPARQVTISLPLKTGIADLRKFRKNVNFQLSQQLHSQIDQIKDGVQALRGNVQGPQPSSLNVGWICSFSIPIVTICALLLLIIIVMVLNIVFWWLPFFEVCLPVPEE